MSLTEQEKIFEKVVVEQLEAFDASLSDVERSFDDEIQKLWKKVDQLEDVIKDLEHRLDRASIKI